MKTFSLLFSRHSLIRLFGTWPLKLAQLFDSGKDIQRKKWPLVAFSFFFFLFINFCFTFSPNAFIAKFFDGASKHFWSASTLAPFCLFYQMHFYSMFLIHYYHFLMSFKFKKQTIRVSGKTFFGVARIFFSLPLLKYWCHAVLVTVSYHFVDIFSFLFFTAAFWLLGVGRQDWVLHWVGRRALFNPDLSLSIPSSHGSSSAQWPPSQSRGGARQLHVNKSDVAFASAQQTAWADPRVPGALCQDA